MPKPLPHSPDSDAGATGSTLHRLKNRSLLSLLGTGPESEFNDLAELAAAVCSTPISLVTLLDEQMLYHKGCVGCSFGSLPRGQTFCEHTVRQDGLFVVADAKTDGRFRTHFLVTREPGIRFYAGVPVYAPWGEKAGALCVIDSIRRELKPWQARALAVLAQQVNARIELRVRRREAELALEPATENGTLFAAFAHALPFPCYLKDKEHRLRFYNRALADRFGIDQREWLGKISLELWPPEIAGRIQAAEERVFSTGVGSDLRIELAQKDRTATSWLLHQRLCRTPESEPLLAVAAMEEYPG